MTYAEVKHIHWQGAKLRVRVTAESVEVDGTARDGKAIKRNFKIEAWKGCCFAVVIGEAFGLASAATLTLRSPKQPQPARNAIAAIPSAIPAMPHGPIFSRKTNLPAAATKNIVPQDDTGKTI